MTHFFNKYSVVLILSLLITGSTSGSSQRNRQIAVSADSTAALYRKLAYYHAPINFQDTEVQGDSQDSANPDNFDHPIQRRGDFMIRFDFDGDWNGLNNWAAFSKRAAPGKPDEMARAFMYYSVVETATHYIIVYCAYHAQDREPRCSDSECHENDLEGSLHLVKKGPENGGMGTVWLMMTLAHDYWFTYLTPAGKAAGIHKGGKPPHETPAKAHHYNADFIYDVIWRGVTPNGDLFIPRDSSVPSDPDAPHGTVFHPTTWEEPWGHGMYGWPGPNSQSPYDRYRKPQYPWKEGFINGDGIIYYPSPKAGIPDYNKPVDVVPFELIDIFEPNGLWDRREKIDWQMDGCGGGANGTPDCTWGHFGAFRGERWGTDKANAPWRWNHSDAHLQAGMQSYDPFCLIEEFNNLSEVPADRLSRAYTNNRYLGLPKNQNSKRPLPIARINSKVFIVRPGENFTLNGASSQTGDLNGRGHLLYRWTSTAGDWPDSGWSEPIIRQTLSREGTYRVNLTVNDGDNSATDSATIVVTNHKLFFDDFQSDPLLTHWQFLGQTWRAKDGALTVRRPGNGLNIATADAQSARDVTIETRMRLDMLYQEAAVPFGIGFAIQNGDSGRGYLLFGFVGTRRIDHERDSSRRHMTEVAFYELSATKRGSLGDRILTWPKGFDLGTWYQVKLRIEGGQKLKAKIWPVDDAEPDWSYEVTLGHALQGKYSPILVGGAGTSGEASYGYLSVQSN